MRSEMSDSGEGGEKLLVKCCRWILYFFSRKLSFAKSNTQRLTWSSPLTSPPSEISDTSCRDANSNYGPTTDSWSQHSHVFQNPGPTQPTAVILAEFTCDLRYLPGPVKLVAHAFSRPPQQQLGSSLPTVETPTWSCHAWPVVQRHSFSKSLAEPLSQRHDRNDTSLLNQAHAQYQCGTGGCT